MFSISTWQIKYRRHFGDAMALTLLAVGAWLAAGFLWRDDIFIYGDHAGHYFLAWFAMHIAIPEQMQIAAWMPHWYAGYPVLQFYPPGAVLLAASLRAATLQQISPELAYQLVIFIAYSLPGFTFYYALRHLRFDVLTAFAGGAFGLVFVAVFDGTLAPFIGMTSSRIAFGLNPLVVVWLIAFAERRGARYWFLATAALAAMILFHPYHPIGILFAVALYILFARLPLVNISVRVVGVIAGALMLDAFWLAPLLAHSSSQMIPLLRTTFDQTWRELTAPGLYPFALLALVGLSIVRETLPTAQRAFILALAALVFLLGAFMLAVHVVLIDSLGIYQIDPVRLIGEYYFALILLAAIGLGALARRAAAWWSRDARMRTILAASVVGIVCAAFAANFYYAHEKFFPRANDEPRFLQDARAQYQLDEFWQVLRATPGRVWFTSYTTPLKKFGTEPFPTTLAALTPLFAGRDMIGGTYSLWSPVAALMWVGELETRVLHGLAEETNDRALFGVSTEALSDELLLDWVQRFNVTTVVASEDDYQTRLFLDASLHFQSYYNNGLFYAYRVLNYENAWVQGVRANIDRVEYHGSAFSFHVRRANENAVARVKVAAAPNWRAQTSAEQTLAIERDAYGLIEIPLPRGRDYAVTLRYEMGMVERVSAVISFSALGAFLFGAAILVFQRARVRVKAY